MGVTAFGTKQKQNKKLSWNGTIDAIENNYYSGYCHQNGYGSYTFCLVTATVSDCDSLVHGF